MTRSLLVFILSSILCFPVLALDKSKWQPIGEGMMRFPDQPTEKAFRSVETSIGALPKLEKSEDDRHAGLLAAVFLASAHKRHGWTLATNNQFHKQAMEIASGKSKLAAYMRDDNLIDSSKFDVWWISYMGSQDEAYLFKLLKYAGSPAPKNDVNKALLVNVATWSFKSNCEQIRGVREFARRRLSDPDYKDKAPFLRECVKTK